jgi:hypothetical protein
MLDTAPFLSQHLDENARAFLEEAQAAVGEKGVAHIGVLLPQLARRVGREPLRDAGHETRGDLQLDLSAWRTCDLAGAALLGAQDVDDAFLRDLYWHGDMEEKTIVLRSLALREITQATVDLLGEVQRTNVNSHVEAGALDSNLVARALRAGGRDTGFTQDDFHRLVLKMAFSDFPVSRLFEGLDCGTETLSRMLQDFATEREAAGRAVWVDTWRFIARHPTAGSRARIIGGLEHGSDPVRTAAAEAVLLMQEDALTAFAKERLPREPRDDIRALLQQAAG